MRQHLMLGATFACMLIRSPLTFAQASRDLRPGTYALRLCRVTCDPRYPKNTFRSGWIVLGAAPLDLPNMPDSVRKWLELHFMMQADEGQANGCFHFTANRPEVRTYASVAGLLRWERRGSGDSAAFKLYQSPDAGHNVQVAATPRGFSGSGHSWGAGVAAVDYPDDLVVGEYLGPPNVARCEEAGYAVLAEMRAVLAHTHLRRPPCDSARAAQVALDSVNKVYDFPSAIDRFEWNHSGDEIRIVTAPHAPGVRDGMTIVRLDERCRIRSLVQRDSA